MRQKHGQNFLTDLNIANNIIKAAHLEKEDIVLEIGPGKGVLTKLIQPQVKRLTAVEIDQTLFTQLQHYFNFHNINNVELVNADFLKLQTAKLSGSAAQQLSNDKEKDVKGSVVAVNRAAELPSCRTSELPFKVISNLPYNVGTAIIQKVLPLNNWTLCVLMLQKEVAHRIAARPGSKDYGYISVFCSYYADCEILFDVSPRCFNPQPKVVSTVIKLTNKLSGVPDPLFFEFVKHCFGMRRKTILNSLSSFAKLDKTAAGQMLAACNLDPFLRPDKLTLSDFLRLTNEIKKCIILQS